MNLVGRNFIWLIASQLATWVLSLLMVLVVPGILGADVFGTLSFTGAYVGFFTLAASLGTSILLTREVARDRTIVGPYVFNAILLKTVLTSVLSMVALGLGVLLRFSGETLALVAIGCAAMYVFVFNEVFTGALQGLQRMGKSSAALVVYVYVSNLGGILVLANGGGVILFSIVYAAGSLIPMIANGLLVRPMVRGHRHVDLAIWRHLVVGGAPLMLLTVFNQIYGTIDVPIVAAIAGTTTVGWYSLAYRWASIPIFIANAVVGSHYPEMSVHGKTGGPTFVDLVNRAIKIVLFASVPAAVGLAVVAPDLISYYPDGEFDGAIRPLQILALQIPITSMDTVLATALLASDRLRKYLIIAGVAAAINPIACIVLINLTVEAFDNGAIGAAIATAATEVFVMTCALVLSARGVMDRVMVSWSVRCVAAGASIAVVVGLVAEAHLVVKVLLGVVSYAIASVAVGTITPAMIRQTRRQAASMVMSVRQRVAARPPAE